MANFTILEFDTLEDLLRSYESSLMVLNEANGNTALYNGKSKTKIAGISQFNYIDSQNTLNNIEKKVYFLYFFNGTFTWNGARYKKDWYRYNTEDDSFEAMNTKDVKELSGTIAAGSTELELILPAQTTYIASYCKNGNKIVPVDTSIVEPTLSEDGTVKFELFGPQDFDVVCKVKYIG